MKRYKPFKNTVRRGKHTVVEVGLEESKDGEWCRYADVAQLIEEETGVEEHEMVPHPDGTRATQCMRCGWNSYESPRECRTGRQREDEEPTTPCPDCGMWGAIEKKDDGTWWCGRCQLDAPWPVRGQREDDEAAEIIRTFLAVTQGRRYPVREKAEKWLRESHARLISNSEDENE